MEHEEALVLKDETPWPRTSSVKVANEVVGPDGQVRKRMEHVQTEAENRPDQTGCYRHFNRTRFFLPKYGESQSV